MECTEDERRRLALQTCRRCLECAIEVVLGRVDERPAKLSHDCGGGYRVIRSTRHLGG